MDELQPITPPDKLVEQWRTQAPTARDAGATRERWIATRAAKWAADTQLAKDCTWLTDQSLHLDGSHLRAAMRPKRPSLKQQALSALIAINANFSIYKKDADTIRRALEAMSDD